MAGPRLRILPFLLLLIAAVLLVYWPVMGHEFLSWDDFGTLAGNPDYNPPTPEKIARYWTDQYMDLYVPVTFSVWGLIAAVAYQPVGTEEVALNPHLFHAANLILHIGGAIVVFFILRRLIRHQWAAVAGALLYALHPLQVEPVAWASGLKDVLGGLLLLSALLLYIRHAERHQETRRLGWEFGLAAVLFALAMLSKPSTVVLPLLAGVIDLIVIRRRLRLVMASAGLLLLMTVPILIIGRAAQPAAYPADAPWWLRFVIPLDALGFYVRRVVWPVDMVPDYGRSPTWLMQQFGRPMIWGMMLIPVALAGIAIALWRRAPIVAAGIAVFMLAPLPVLGLIPFDFQAASTTADRYLYVAMLGVVMIVAWLLDRPMRWWLVAPLAVVVCLLGWQAHRQTWLWRDTHSLFAHNLQVNPGSLAANRSLGQWATEEGDLPLAEHYLNRAMAIAPHDPLTQARYGDVLMQSRQPWDALRSYEAAIEADPDAPQYLVRAGLAHMEMKQYPQAQRYFEQALEMRPGYLLARLNLARMAMRQQRYAEAVRQYREALEISPGHPEAERGLAESMTHTARN